MDPSPTSSARRRRGRPQPPPPLDAACALFLDIDGTLLELAATPSAVIIDTDVATLLPALHRTLGGACALITGRTLTNFDRLFPGLGLPVAGQHGCERRSAAGAVVMHAPEAATVARLRALLAAFAARHDGLQLEDKGQTLALHYRQAPQLAAHVHRTLRSTLADEGVPGLSLQPGKCLLEVRPGNRDQGTAIADVLAEPPFAGRCPVFVGDDRGDEHGFALVQDLGGFGVKVGPGRTAARHRLGGVAEVRRWLGDLVATTGDGGELR
jgi:trehalose 6-phosphate phosphatase